MRPLDKGLCPKDPATGLDKTVGDYTDWRMDLIDRIGYYCAYCNMPLSHSIQVEHVVPKNPMPGQPAGARLDWDNMLLACGPCNNAKDNAPYNPINYYSPENHNTLFVFQIIAHPDIPNAAIVAPHPTLTQLQTDKAKRTIDLLKLERIDRRPAVVDIRWMKRYDAIMMVDSAYQVYQQTKQSPTFDEQAAAAFIAIIAQQTGFFQLWFSAFITEPSVMEKLIDPTIVPGTAQNCFDTLAGFAPIHRNPGNAADPF